MTTLSIYQSALDVVSDAVLADDFAAYATMIDLPYLVLTDSAQLLVARAEDLRPTFDTLHYGLKARGVSYYKRLARTADYIGPGCIEGWHSTHVISGTDFAAPSRSARQVIVQRGGRWLFSEAQYPIAIDRWPLTDSVLFADPSRQIRPEEARQ